ncbi:hypothetical protein C1I98_01810 [Spongiactinospora gelatinilytica]|uniref:Uncharacterized protein n=1 Tax=Spongiactinospora gelatinilytica TaxID=2666298 RepID=A0A2W2H8T8_9ACTN|nr:hypothetical protein C1I98_01810 [Spongiactinospora gelatinilytica]
MAVPALASRRAIWSATDHHAGAYEPLEMMRATLRLVYVPSSPRSARSISRVQIARTSLPCSAHRVSPAHHFTKASKASWANAAVSRNARPSSMLWSTTLSRTRARTRRGRRIMGRLYACDLQSPAHVHYLDAQIVDHLVFRGHRPE